MIDENKLSELIELTEERDISKTIIKALNLYYEVQKFRAKEYRLSLVPFHIDSGEIDRSRPPIYINDLEDMI